MPRPGSVLYRAFSQLSLCHLLQRRAVHRIPAAAFRQSVGTLFAGYDAERQEAGIPQTNQIRHLPPSRAGDWIFSCVPALVYNPPPRNSGSATTSWATTSPNRSRRTIAMRSGQVRFSPSNKRLTSVLHLHMGSPRGSETFCTWIPIVGLHL